MLQRIYKQPKQDDALGIMVRRRIEIAPKVVTALQERANAPFEHVKTVCKQYQQLSHKHVSLGDDQRCNSAKQRSDTG
ncbi:hypothetical protein [Dictyobacter kobayashii]|uniref:Uncharacterized protein n=1 Tax=Dictyobacter kobayashii TaxID=2014872 RepID=A0A402AJB0_9CHLR|nr:hypothetical protein [Dictyobacter kobayashii]GCE19201.1 hypothetical protein KDK_30010 [Dictyobacter kobayashii]